MWSLEESSLDWAKKLLKELKDTMPPFEHWGWSSKVDELEEVFKTLKVSIEQDRDQICQTLEKRRNALASIVSLIERGDNAAGPLENRVGGRQDSISNREFEGGIARIKGIAQRGL